MNATMQKFGYPQSVVKQYEHWCVLLRPEQATLGALVLACSEPVQNFGSVSADGFNELQVVTRDLEQVLTATFSYQKLNYLMLMMIDPDVHFHVLPRYDSDIVFEGISFADPGWPGPPQLGSATSIDDRVREKLQAALRDNWPT